MVCRLCCHTCVEDLAEIESEVQTIDQEVVWQSPCLGCDEKIPQKGSMELQRVSRDNKPGHLLRFTKHASFLLRDGLKIARLAFVDVSAAQL